MHHNRNSTYAKLKQCMGDESAKALAQLVKYAPAGSHIKDQIESAKRNVNHQEVAAAIKAARKANAQARQQHKPTVSKCVL